MRINLLIEPAMKPIPNTIRVVQSFGDLSVLCDNRKIVRGEHAIIEGVNDAIIDWLLPHSGFWMGVGTPIMQQFTLRHATEL